MSIPFYDDIYHFPGGYPHHHHKHFPKPGLKPSYVQETSKSIDIVDKFGNLRYNVTLSSEIMWDERSYKTIVSQSLPKGIVAFLEIPEDDRWEPDYYKALEDFNCCVKKYQSLVDAEMKDFRDIDIYKDKIGYEVQLPERCCGSCKWCMKTFEDDGPAWDFHHHHHHMHRGKPIKMQCCCPENEQVFNYAKQFPCMPSPRHQFNGWQKLPWQTPDDIDLGKSLWDPRKFPSIMFPTVDMLGICDNYEKGKCQYDKHQMPHRGCQQLAKTIAPAYDVNLSCMPGDLVYYCGTLYVCIEEHNGGIWDKQHFAKTTIDEALKSKVSYDDLQDAISDALSTSLSSYATFDDVSSIASSMTSGIISNVDIVSSQVLSLSNTMSSYTTFADISGLSNGISAATRDIYALSSSLSDYAMLSDVSGYMTSAVLSSYVRNDALSGLSISYSPTQRQMTTVLKYQLSVLGGTIEGGL